MDAFVKDEKRLVLESEVPTPVTQAVANLDKKKLEEIRGLGSNGSAPPPTTVDVFKVIWFLKSVYFEPKVPPTELDMAAMSWDELRNDGFLFASETKLGIPHSNKEADFPPEKKM